MSTKDNGLSLISPPLLSFAQTFVSDLRELFPSQMTSLSVVNSASLTDMQDYVFLTLADPANHTLASGTSTTEGYEMQVSSREVIIRGSGAKGAFWGTRTLLQGLALSNGRFPNGLIHDQPDWETRGIMLGEGSSNFHHCAIIVYVRQTIVPSTDSYALTLPGCIRCWSPLVSHRLPQGCMHIRLMVQN